MTAGSGRTTSWRTSLWLAAGAAVAFGVLAQVAVVELPVLQTAFGTASLDLVHWAVCVAMASAVLWFEELRKLLGRTLSR